MRNKWLAAVLIVWLPAFAQHWQIASPGYPYQFPRDYFNHPAYQTEWWYYTGNLRAPDGHRFGFELTFFRVGIHLPQRVTTSTAPAWRPDEIYLAHFAVSDLDGKKFFHTERLNRSGPGLAGASLDQRSYWNGNWRVTWNSPGEAVQQLQAVSDQFTLELSLRPAKPVILNGRNGISRKGPGAAEASHYLSFTRLLASGSLKSAAGAFQLDGLAWMDHEFFSEERNSSIAGWDWFAIQLDNNEELMLYRLRSKSGQPNAYSSGTYVDAAGLAHHLNYGDFALQPGGEWKSTLSGTEYPLAWNITVPSLDLQLREETPLKDQELFSKNALTPTYWEGAVIYSGQIHKQPVHGVGYLELTGYNQAVWFRER